MKIPAGSANILVTQHAYVDGKTEDDNYLGENCTITVNIVSKGK